MKTKRDLLYRVWRPFYIEAVATVEEDPDDDQVFLVAVARRWHPRWWFLKRKMKKLDIQKPWRPGY